MCLVMKLEMKDTWASTWRKTAFSFSVGMDCDNAQTSSPLLPKTSVLACGVDLTAEILSREKRRASLVRMNRGLSITPM